MNVTTFNISTLTLLMAGSALNPVNGQFGDPLNEVPLSPVPEEMTLEEYRDMNRRMTVGLLLSAIPFPGIIHSYAAEKRTQRRILAVAALGLGSIVVAIASNGDQKFPESDFALLILNTGDAEKGRRYAKIPIEISGADTTYRLQELFRRGDGSGAGFALLGVGLIAGAFIYDTVHGLLIIEKKRDLVRFKYGKTLSLSVRPTVDPRRGSAGVTLSFGF